MNESAPSHGSGCSGRGWSGSTRAVPLPTLCVLLRAVAAQACPCRHEEAPAPPPFQDACCVRVHALDVLRSKGIGSRLPVRCGAQHRSPIFCFSFLIYLSLRTSSTLGRIWDAFSAPRSPSDIALFTAAKDPRPSASFSARTNPWHPLHSAEQSVPIPANTPPVFRACGLASDRTRFAGYPLLFHMQWVNRMAMSDRLLAEPGHTDLFPRRSLGRVFDSFTADISTSTAQSDLMRPGSSPPPRSAYSPLFHLPGGRNPEGSRIHRWTPSCPAQRGRAFNETGSGPIVCSRNRSPSISAQRAPYACRLRILQPMNPTRPVPMRMTELGSGLAIIIGAVGGPPIGISVKWMSSIINPPAV